MPCVESLPTAVDTNTRSPHTIGLETAMPGTGVLHATFSPAGAFHFTAVGVPSASPAAFAPRKAGQCCADSETLKAKPVKSVSASLKPRRAITFPPSACRRPSESVAAGTPPLSRMNFTSGASSDSIAPLNASSLAGSALRDRQLGDLGVFGPLPLRRTDGEHQRREAVEGVLDREIRTLVEQHLDDLDMAVIAREGQRRRVVAEPGVDVDAFVEQLPHRRGVTLAGGILQLLGTGRRRGLGKRDDRGKSHDPRHCPGPLVLLSGSFGRLPVIGPPRIAGDNSQLPSPQLPKWKKMPNHVPWELGVGGWELEFCEAH